MYYLIAWIYFQHNTNMRTVLRGWILMYYIILYCTVTILYEKIYSYKNTDSGIVASNMLRKSNTHIFTHFLIWLLDHPGKHNRGGEYLIWRHQDRDFFWLRCKIKFSDKTRNIWDWMSWLRLEISKSQWKDWV